MKNNRKKKPKQILNLVLALAMIFTSVTPVSAMPIIPYDINEVGRTTAEEDNALEALSEVYLMMTFNLNGATVEFEEGDFDHLSGLGVSIVEVEDGFTEDIFALQISEALTLGELDLPEVVRAGFDFDGWNTEADGNGEEIDAETEITEDVTVYAQWRDESAVDDAIDEEDDVEDELVDSDEEATRDRVSDPDEEDDAELVEDVAVNTAPLNVVEVSTFEQLRTAVNNAGTTPTTIHLMASTINTETGVPITIGANQNITLLNGQAGATSRVNIIRDQAPPGGNTTASFQRGQHFEVIGRLQLGQDGGSAQSSNITLDNNLRAGPTGHNGLFPNNFVVRGGVFIGQFNSADNNNAHQGSNPNAHFIIYDGVIMQNLMHADNGGAVRIQQGTFTMNGGILQHNMADANFGNQGGGGAVAVMTNQAHFILNDGIIQDNEIAPVNNSNAHGGGVVIQSGGTFTMNNGIIRDHTLHGVSSGGGVAVVGNGSVFNMNGGEITNNQAVTNAGGIVLRSTMSANLTTTTTAQFNMRAGTISHNSVVAPTANGGGIFTVNPTFNNINLGNVDGVNTSDQIHFYGNTSTAHNGSPLMIDMGVDGGRTTFPNIRWNNWLNAHNSITTSLSAHSHLINNWDVNVSAQTPYSIQTVVMLQNSGSDGRTMTSTNPAFGPEDTDSVFAHEGATVTGNVGTRPGFYFNNLTTQPEVSGVHNSTSPEFSLTMPNVNVFITANWNRRVTFDLNGGSGVAPADRVIGENQAIGTLPATPTHPNGYTFAGWRLADGTNVTATTINEGVGHFTVTAHWFQPPTWATPTPAEGNLGTFVPGFVNINFVTVNAIGYGSQPMTYSISENPSWIEVNPTTGVISITGIPAGDYGTHSFTVTASNGTMPNATRTFNIMVGETPLITTSSLPFAIAHIENRADVAYHETIEASGRPAPTFSIIEGELPPGLSLDEETGEMTGVAVELPVGKYTDVFDFTVEATNVAGTVTQDLSIAVHTRPTINEGEADEKNVLPSSPVNEPISYHFTASGSTQDLVWSYTGNLPDGLSLDTNTGILSGIPTVIDGFDFTVIATNVTGSAHAYSRDFSIQIQAVPVTSVQINEGPSLTLTHHDDDQLTATVFPDNATHPNVTWSSSNPSVITVDGDTGEIIAEGPGTAMISVTTEDGNHTDEIIIVVEPRQVTGIEVVGEDMVLIHHDTDTIIFDILPNNATNQAVTFESSDSSIATVDADGLVTGVNVGTTTITVTTEDGNHTDTINIEVIPREVTGIEITREDMVLVHHDTDTIIFDILPTNATNQAVTFESSDSSIATVDADGLVTGVNVGTTRITVTTEDGNHTDTINIEVIPREVTGVEIDQSDLTLNIGDEDALTATVLPYNATNQKITWSSSDQEVVIIDPETGRLAAVGEGTAIITVTTQDGNHTDTITITVRPIVVTSVVVSPAVATLQQGSMRTLTATVTPTDATNQNVTWSSSDDRIATVNENGLVTGIAPGMASITVTTEDGGHTATSVITVMPGVPGPVTGVEINQGATLTMIHHDTYQLTATILPSNASNQNVTWSSSHPSIATVNAFGYVTGTGVGTATITVTTIDGGHHANMTVTVDPRPVTSVSIDQDDFDLVVGVNHSLTATVTPTHATSQNVTWSSDDPTIASVDGNGVVTAVGAGEATITVTTEDGGFTDTVVVTVTTAQVRVTGVTVTPSMLTLPQGNNEVLIATVLPANATNQEVVWSTNAPETATVNTSGDVTGVTPGVAIITATTVDGGFTATSMIMVMPGTVTPLPTINLTPDRVVVNDTDLMVSSTVGGTATGVITIDDTVLPTGVTATVSDHVITISGVRPIAGQSAITGTYIVPVTREGVTTNLTVDVDLTPEPDLTNVPVTGVTVTPMMLTLPQGNMRTLTATVLPANATNQEVVWSTNAPEIATVSTSGDVTGVAPGTAFITAETVDGGHIASSIIMVTSETVTPQPTINLTPDTVVVTDTDLMVSSTVGGTATGVITIDDTVLPTGVTATVSGHVITITGVRPMAGQSAITGTYDVPVTREGVTTNLTVDVDLTPERDSTNVPVTGVQLPMITMVSQSTPQPLIATVLPTNASNQEILWSSDDPSLVEINSNNEAVAHASSGTAIITAETVDGGFTATTIVIIIP